MLFIKNYYRSLLALFCLFLANNSLFSQELGKLYLSVAGTGRLYDITGIPATPTLVTTPAYFNTGRGNDVSTLAVAYDVPSNPSSLVYVHSGTTPAYTIYKNGSGSILLPATIGGLGANNVLGSQFGYVYGFANSGKNLYRVLPTVSSVIPITGDAEWNAATSSIFSSDSFFDYQNNIYTILQNVVSGITTRYLYKIAINGTTATATKVFTITGPVGTANANAGESTTTDTGNIRGLAYLNGLIYAASGTSVANTMRIYSINIATGASQYLTDYTGTNFGSGNFDLASGDYFLPFTFDCGSIYQYGNPYISGVSSDSYLVIPISNIHVDGSYTVNVSGTDFTNASQSAYVDTGYPYIVVPLTYNGTGLPGSRNLTINLEGTTTTCSYTIQIGANMVANNDNLGIVNAGTTTTASVLINDIYNGNPATASNITVSFPNPPAGFTINANGTINIAANVGPGIYPINYQICDTAPGNCKKAIVQLEVSGGQTTNIDEDGIPNSTDLDDDNDGIPDAVECATMANIAGSFGSNAPGWSYGKEWQYFGDFSLIDDGATNADLNYTLRNLSSNNTTIPLNIDLKVGDGNGTGGFSGTFQVLLNGVLYATITNGIDQTPSINNVTITHHNGATSNFVPYSIANSAGGPFTLNIPNNNIPLNPLLTFRVSTYMDDFFLDSVSIMSLACDTDSDGVPNHLDLDSDNDGCLDALEGDENVTAAMLTTAAPGLKVGTGSSASNMNLCASGGCVNAQGIPLIVNSGGGADIGSDAGQGIGDSQNATVSVCPSLTCYKPAITTGTILPTTVGITSLTRSNNNSQWQDIRKGGWLALEAKTKGFVPNRLSSAQIANIPPANLVEGMMVYNITADCLQMNIDGTPTGWKCINKQTCPN